MNLGLVSVMRRPVLSAVTWAYGGLRSGESPRHGLRILTYHAVGTPVEGDIRSLYSIPPDRFEAHMRFLAENHLDRLVRLGPGSPMAELMRVAVTFDDGYMDNLAVAAPIMARLGIPFTVFVCTGAVSERRKGFLGPEDVRELARMPGAAVGSHSVSHPRLTRCDERTLREELAGSKAYLEDLLGSEVESLAYPHGDVNIGVRDMAEKACYRIGASTRFDINQPGRDPLLLCRTDIWADDSIPVFEQKLRGDWDWNRWRSTDPACV